MSPERPFHFDIRTDVAGLSHRAGIEAAPVIDCHGRAVSNVSVCLPGVDLRLASLPRREGPAHPRKWAGAAVVGTRERRLDGDMLHSDGHVEICSWEELPSNRAAIASLLLSESGLAHAPDVVLQLGGWHVDSAFDGLDRLRCNGAEAKAIVTACRGSAALRQMALLVINQDADDLERVGAVRVVRAAIDAAIAVVNVVDDAIGSGPIGLSVRGALIKQLHHSLNSLTEKLESAAALKSAYRRRCRLKAMISAAQSFFDSIDRFTFASQDWKKRAKKMIDGLAKTGVASSSVADWGVAVGLLNTRLHVAAPTSAQPDWHEGYLTGVIAGLAQIKAPDRQAAIAAIRCDLIYRLIMTRRLDRVYNVMPWLCVPSTIFPRVFGGLLGAVAQLFELARAMEIGHELKRRLFDPGDDERLDKKKATKAFATPRAAGASVLLRRRAGFLLAEAAMSHRMVEAFLADAPLDPRHPIPTALGGRLNWSFKRSMRDVPTVETAITVELASPVYQSNGDDKDVPRYMGMSLLEMLSCALCEIFLPSRRGLGYRRQRAAIGEGEGAKDDGSDIVGSDLTSRAHYDAMLSMLLIIDLYAPKDSATTVQDADQPVSVRTIEVNRLTSPGDRRCGSRRNRTAQGLRKAGNALVKLRGERAFELRDLVDAARIPVTDRSTIQAADEPLARVLRRDASLPGSMPIAHVFYHVLWFRPDIDCEILGWLGQLGDPSARPPGTGDAEASSVRAKIEALKTRAKNGIRRAPPGDRAVRTLVPIFTGLTGTTVDDAHVEGLTLVAQLKKSEVQNVTKDGGTKDNDAAPAYRPGTPNGDKGHKGRSRDRANFAIQSTLWGGARSGIDFRAGSRVEGCRTDQRRTRDRGP